MEEINLMFWRCEQIGRCKARILTRFGDVVKFINTHTHDSSPSRDTYLESLVAGNAPPAKLKNTLTPMNEFSE